MAITRLLLVFSVVLVTLATAMLLDYGAKQNNLLSLSSFLIVTIVIIINFAKFKVWGIIYKRFHLSESYPLVALFFPLVYAVSIYNGEAKLEANKVIGIVLILFGIFILNSRKVNI